MYIRGRVSRLLVWFAVAGSTGHSFGAGTESHRRNDKRVFRIEREEDGYRRMYYASLCFRADEGELILWNRGADPQLNPVMRVRFALPAVRDSSGWRYEGMIFRSRNPGRPVRIESGTKLESYRSGLDFVLRESDRESRYRLGGKSR